MDRTMIENVNDGFSINAIIDSWSEQKGDEVIYRFLTNGGTDEEVLTYRQLLDRSTSFARVIMQYAKPGDRAMIMIPSSLEFLIAFFACLRSAVIAVPLYPPRNKIRETRLNEIALSSNPRLLITSNKNLKKTERFLKESKLKKEFTKILCIDNSPSELKASHISFPVIDPETVAFIQYTSGSTASPKGVMVTHKNLISNSLASSEAMRNFSGSIHVSWLPFYHDLGIIGAVIQPLYRGYPAVLMSPNDFFLKPIIWLKAISSYKGTCSGAPNFAYDLLSAEFEDKSLSGLDLSSWRVAYCGAEPIHLSTLESFFQRFKKYGLSREALYPCYGMAEATLFISGLNKGDTLYAQKVSYKELSKNNTIVSCNDKVDTRDIVCCGRADSIHDIKIVSPETMKVLEENQVGEIWFSGPSVAAGYWKDEENTEKTFKNRLPGRYENGSLYLRTGDLGYLSDECLYITGRIKEVIIIRGANYYPQDIEKTVSQAHEALIPGASAAFGITINNTEKLIVVQEVKRTQIRKLKFLEVFNAVQKAVFIDYGLRLHDFVLLKPGRVPKTTSGKIERISAKRIYLSNQFKIMDSLSGQSTKKAATDESNKKFNEKMAVSKQRILDRAKFIETLKTCIGETLNVPAEDIPHDVPIAGVGLDSISLISIFAKLETIYHQSFSPALIYRFPTIERLADALADEPKAQAASDASRPLSQTHNEPIAIVGMAGQMPGSPDLDVFWQNLVEGRDLISEIPTQRWDWRSLDANDPVKWGGFISGVGEFDAPFFGISPHEASLMDPQQRLFLQTVWHAIEDAAINPDDLSGTATGVFVGAATVDYFELTRVNDIASEGHSTMAFAHSMIANRVSNFLNIRGPSEAVDTACSSSLVAIHRAVNAIQSGECDMAIAGGVSLMLTPWLHTACNQAGMLSKDGRCKTFDQSANGYVRGEGVGAVFLKRLSQAESEGDPIYGLIKGSAVNHSGGSNALTAPNVLAQQEVITSAYAKAAIDPSTVGYIESHGTGTSLGDPAELDGLKGAFSRLYAQWGPKMIGKAKIGIGSVKTNIGHLESAAGIAGVIKVLLAIKHQTLPATLHCKKVNPYIDLNQSPFYLNTEKQTWRQCVDDQGKELPRRASISSFGFGGVNAHLVIEEYLPSGQTQPENLKKLPPLIVLSAKTSASLRLQAARLLNFVHRNKIDTNSLTSLAYTLQVGRKAMKVRLAFVARSKEALCEKLGLYLEAQPGVAVEGLIQGCKSNSNCKAFVLFTQDEDIKMLCNSWFAKQKYHKLLELWAHGGTVDWHKLYEDKNPKRMRIPVYQFERNTYWILSRADRKAEGSVDRSVSQTSANIVRENSYTAPETFSYTLKPAWISVPKKTGSARKASNRFLLVGKALVDHVPFKQSMNAIEIVPYTERDSDITLRNNLIKLKYDPDKDHILWLMPAAEFKLSHQCEAIIDAQEYGVIGFFRLIKALLHLGCDTKFVDLTVLTFGAQQVFNEQVSDPAAAGLTGLAGCISREYSIWKVSVFDLARDRVADVFSDSVLAAVSFAKRHAAFKGDPNILAYRNDRWYKQVLLPIHIPTVQQDIYKRKGVYVVIGGAGGIGSAWTEMIVRDYQANVIWIGRSNLNEKIIEKQNRIGAYGPEPHYICADATDHLALQSAYNEIKEKYGKIDGVIHSALVLNDRSFSAMDERIFRSVLAAKVNSSVYLANVFKEEELDFICFLSSLSSFVMPAGQSNYVSGCCFQDSFAAMLSFVLPEVRIRVINWGYWGSIGAASSDDYRKRMKKAGFGSIEPSEGMAVLKKLLGSSINQLAYLNVYDYADLNRLNINRHTRQRYYPAPDNAYVDQKIKFTPIPVSEEIKTFDSDMMLLEAQLTELLFVELHSAGFLNFADDRDPIHHIAAGLGIEGMYIRWLKTSIDILLASNLLTHNDSGGIEATSKGLNLKKHTVRKKWKEFCTSHTANKNLDVPIRLISKTVDALLEIITGSRSATEVLFENGDMNLIKGVYQNNPQADYFNTAICRPLIDYIKTCKDLKSGGPFRIIEVGAGTGGTSRAVFQALEQFTGLIDEYCYTDISKAFLTYAKQQFASIAPYLNCKLFDVTRHPGDQGIKLGSFDVVIASNVLHATQDIRKTLKHVKALLHDNGLLILNEINSLRLFTHLFFGLLEGWWLYEDSNLRIDGTPGLRLEKWTHLLAENGFKNFAFPASQGHKFGQQVIVAFSDGIIPASPDDALKLTAPQSMNSKKMVRNADMINAEIVPQMHSASSAFSEGKPNSGSNPIDGETVQLRINRILSEILQINADDISIDEPFNECGLDSINGLKFVERLNQEFGIHMEVTSLYDYPSSRKLGRYIFTEIEGRPAIRQPDMNSEFETKQTHDSATTNADDRDQSTFIRTTHAAGVLEDIAIIGMSGRFAGANDLDAFWNCLCGAKELICETRRWNLDEQYKRYLPGDSKYCTRGGFIDDIDLFDNQFFNIPAIEARHMDPQQRIFLQDAWHALEDAGYAGKNGEGRRGGVYVGCVTGDYGNIISDHPPAQAFWGNAGSVIASRIAYFLDLKGPSVAVDTACSSSLVAIHLACQSLWLYENEFALAGGVFISCTPQFYISANRASMLSPQGKCYSFDSRADGFVPGEGSAAIVLKRASDAIRDGDNIIGLIKATAMNQDGASNGITAPSAQSQTCLVREVYDNFSIDPGTIQMVEAHGTGTPLGDPIEFRALTDSFRHYTESKSYCAIGSVKTNIGHCVTAAGIAGVIKILLSIKHRQIPASLNYRQHNKRIDFANSPFYLNTQTRHWHVNAGEKRRAAVSSLGISGTNVHMVIEEAPDRQQYAISSSNEDSYCLIVVSADSADQLDQQLSSLYQWSIQITENTASTVRIKNIANTLMTGRRHCNYRFAAVVKSIDQLMDTLKTALSKTNTFSDVAPDFFIDEVNSQRTNKNLENKELSQKGNHIIQFYQVLDHGSDDSAKITTPQNHKEQLRVLADCYVKGVDLDYTLLFSKGGFKRISLPCYPFAKTSFWGTDNKPSNSIRDDSQRGCDAFASSSFQFPFLANCQDISAEQGVHQFTTRIDLNHDRFSFLKDHVVFGEVWLPGAAFLEIAIEGALQALIAEAHVHVTIRNAVFLKPVTFANGDIAELKLDLTKHGNESNYRFTISSRFDSQPDSYWEENAYGHIVLTNGDQKTIRLSVKGYQSRSLETLSAENIYRQFNEIGIDYGAAFQGIESGWACEDAALIKLVDNTTSGSAKRQRSSLVQNYILHPSVLDSGLQSAILAGRSCLEPSQQVFIPVGIGNLKFHTFNSNNRQTPIKWAVCRTVNIKHDEGVFDIALLDEQGLVLVEINDFRLAASSGVTTPGPDSKISIPGTQRKLWIEEYLKNTISRITDEKDIPLRKPFKELIADSLMLLDLKNSVIRDLKIDLNTEDLTESRTIEELTDFLDSILGENPLTNDDRDWESMPDSDDIQTADTALIDRAPVNTVDYLPVTRDVLRLLRTEQMGTPNAAHNIGLAVRLLKRTTFTELENFLRGLANRHAALRMAIVKEDSNDYQFEIHNSLDKLMDQPLLQVVRISNDVDLHNESKKRLDRLMSRPFNLSKAPLWRFELFETSSGDQVLLFGAHHAVSDFQSLLLFMSELDQMLAGKKLSHAVSNADANCWIKSQVYDRSTGPGEERWHGAFSGCQRLELTLSALRPEKPSYRQGSVTLSMTDEMMEGITRQAQKIGFTTAAFCLGAFSILLSRLTLQSSFAIAVPVDTRIHLDALDAFGFFGVPVPIPVLVKHEDTLIEVMQWIDRQLDRVLQKGAAIADAVPELIKEGLAKEGAPLVEAYFNYIRPGFSVKNLEPFDSAPGLFDIDLMVIFSAAMKTVSVYYNEDIIIRNDAELLGNAYIGVLKQTVAALAAENTGISVHRVDLPKQWRKSPANRMQQKPDALDSPAIESVEPLSLAFSASFSIARLSELIQVAHANANQPIIVQEAPYHQVLASLIDPSGIFMKEKVESGVVLLRAIDMARFKEISDQRLQDLENEYFNAFVKLSTKTGISLIVGFLPTKVVQSTDERYVQWDRRLAKRLQKHGSLLVLQEEDWIRHYPVGERFDEVTDQMGHVPFTLEFQASVALTLTRVMWGLRRPPVKVVAVDGDNTLWKGVAAEIGPENVKLSGAYRTFAKKLLTLRDAGVLLLLVSKNDEQTLLEVLALEQSILKKEHFAVIAHGWNRKPDRLKDCASKLNLGLDSFVFLDDNPAEIAMVRSELPEVFSVTVPGEHELEEFLEHLWALDITAVTEEDKKRAYNYQVERKRQALRADAMDFEHFIAALELNIEFQQLNSDTQERTTQLSKRSNQFNMRPQALDPSTIEALLNQGAEIWTASVTDRFGDYGLVCVLVLQVKGKTLEVINWMLSCRVLGRTVEEKVLQWLAKHAKYRGCTDVLLGAEKTQRNLPARGLVAALGNNDIDATNLEARVCLERLCEFKYWEVYKVLDEKQRRNA